MCKQIKLAERLQFMITLKRLFVIVPILGLLTGGCAVFEAWQLHALSYIQVSSAQALFEVSGAFLEVEGERERVSLYCQGTEGAGCHLTPRALLDAWDGLSYNPTIEDLANRIDPALARVVMSDIGFETILDAGRSGVKLGCERPLDQPEQIRCLIDYNDGGGWRELPVR